MSVSVKKLFKTILYFLNFMAVTVSFPPNDISSSFELSIIHFSDFHARYLPINPGNNGLCYDYVKDKCVGGIARVATIVRKLKQNRPNPIFLNAGDNFQGTLYYAVYRGNITATFMNRLFHNAMTLGNHDFDDGISGLASYIKQLNAPVVVTNIDATDEPTIKDLFVNSTIIRRGDKNIGVIGVIFSDTNKISSTTGKLKFLNEVETVNLEAKKLKDKGINIIIVLSHCGLSRDKIIAENTPDVDVIVGGHSHILLYNGVPPTDDIVLGQYPIVVSQKENNRKVLIVHAGAFTKYIGDLRIVFDEKDEVSHWKGNPIFLNKNIKEDPLILEELKPWKVEVDRLGKQFIGKTSVFLNGSCASGECNFGDFITDAMIDYYNGEASISFMNANSIQNSIPKGPILYEDIFMSLPYNNSWNLIELQGNDLLQVLEENVAKSLSNTTFINIKFLNLAGLKVVYNLTNEYSKVFDVKVRCLECKDKQYENLNENKIYKVVVPDYLLTSDFETISKKYRNRIVGKTKDVDNLINYIKKIKDVNVTTESRITFV